MAWAILRMVAISLFIAGPCTFCHSLSCCCCGCPLWLWGLVWVCLWLLGLLGFPVWCDTLLGERRFGLLLPSCCAPFGALRLVVVVGVPVRPWRWVMGALFRLELVTGWCG